RVESEGTGGNLSEADIRHNRMLYKVHPSVRPSAHIIIDTKEGRFGPDLKNTHQKNEGSRSR
ncbi:hypothetical protein BCR33DRAFT_715595, partial [Rhizoclosmatium globosum]